MKMNLTTNHTNQTNKKILYVIFSVFFVLSVIFYFSCKNDLIIKLTEHMIEEEPDASTFIEMVNIPGATDWLVAGSYPAGGTATITGFKMSKYEVTQEQYENVMGTNPSGFDNTGFKNGLDTTPAAGEVQGKRPVEMVTWYDAIEFCNKLSEKEGLQPVYTIAGRTPTTGYPITAAEVTADWSKNGYRLPTEVQWQYAAQSGSDTEYTATTDNAWYWDNSSVRTHEVGKKDANGFGLHDMLGNVFEWCWDWLGSTYPNPNASTNPTGTSFGYFRMFRGGCWNYSASDARSAYRDNFLPDAGTEIVGFRVVRP